MFTKSIITIIAILGFAQLSFGQDLAAQLARRAGPQIKSQPVTQLHSGDVRTINGQLYECGFETAVDSYRCNYSVKGDATGKLNEIIINSTHRNYTTDATKEIARKANVVAENVQCWRYDNHPINMNNMAAGAMTDGATRSIYSCTADQKVQIYHCKYASDQSHGLNPQFQIQSSGANVINDARQQIESTGATGVVVFSCQPGALNPTQMQTQNPQVQRNPMLNTPNFPGLNQQQRFPQQPPPLAGTLAPN